MSAQRTKKDSANNPLTKPRNEQPEEGYFYCPNCGEIDFEFFEEVAVRHINKKQYKLLSEEQKLYINEKYEYGVCLCEHCFNKIKRKWRIFRGLSWLTLILLYNITIIAFCLIPIILYIEFFLLTYNFDFEHAWKCRAVRRISSD